MLTYICLRGLTPHLQTLCAPNNVYNYDIMFCRPMFIVIVVIIITIENVAIIAMYCHLRPPDAIAIAT